MRPERFYEIIENPENITKDDLQEVELLVEEFPWFQAAQALLLKSHLMAGSFRFSQQLSRIAINTGDRQNLYQWLHIETKKILHVSNNPLSNLSDFSDNLQHVSSAELRMHENRALRKQELEKLLSDKGLLYFEFDYVPDKFELQQTITRKPEAVVGSQADLQTAIEKSGDELTDETKNWLAENIEKARRKVGRVSSEKTKNEDIIDKFISLTERKMNKSISDDKASEIQDYTKKSTEESSDFFTETMAKIYIKQGLYEKAIATYEKLSLKYPEKIIYFAGRISEIKELLNNQ